MKMKNSVIENFEKALADLCRSARKENLNVNLDIYTGFYLRRWAAR